MSGRDEPSPNPRHWFLIYVKSLSGTTTTFEVRPQTTVAQLKSEIQLKFGLGSGAQWLLYKGKQLNEAHTMADCGIGKDAVIQLGVRARGG